MADSLIIQAQPLAAAIRLVVAAGGSSDHESTLVADNLVQTNLTGHDSHGVGMIPRYVGALLEGGLVANRHARVVVDAGAMLAVDGARGYGQVIGREAIDLAVGRARALGSCVLSLANSHHLGRIGAWAEQAAAAGLVSIHFVNVQSRPIVAPWGGSDGRHGTNPFCAGIPRRDAPPILVDFATSRIAQGKTRVAHNKGTALDPDCLVDDRGRPTTDPRYGVVEPFGALLPFGEHKGSALALACELLGGALTGSGTWRRPYDRRINVTNGMLSILIDPHRLGTAEAFVEETEGFLEWVSASPPAAGFDRVRVAGDPERESRERRSREGIEIDATTWAEILDAGARLGVEPASVERAARLRD